jgi:hypothetical protein
MISNKIAWRFGTGSQIAWRYGFFKRLRLIRAKSIKASFQRAEEISSDLQFKTREVPKIGVQKVRTFEVAVPPTA